MYSLVHRRTVSGRRSLSARRSLTSAVCRPYEDIAFTIVNKGWERSHKRGFRYVRLLALVSEGATDASCSFPSSSFDRGVLQLHFTFQRTFYRK